MLLSTALLGVIGTATIAPLGNVGNGIMELQPVQQGTANITIPNTEQARQQYRGPENAKVTQTSDGRATVYAYYASNTPELTIQTQWMFEGEPITSYQYLTQSGTVTVTDENNDTYAISVTLTGSGEEPEAPVEEPESPVEEPEAPVDPENPQEQPTTPVEDVEQDVDSGNTDSGNTVTEETPTSNTDNNQSGNATENVDNAESDTEVYTSEKETTTVSETEDTEKVEPESLQQTDISSMGTFATVGTGFTTAIAGAYAFLKGKKKK